jgi:O-antigen ligase
MLNFARWSLVALAASVALGSATMNIISAVLLAALIAAGGYREHVKRIKHHAFAIASVAMLLLLAIGMMWTSGPTSEAVRITEKHARILLAVFAVILVVDERWQRRALMAWVAVMALTLALSYVHSLWAFPLARATREGVGGDHYIFKHHITQNVMMSVFVVAALCEAVRAWQQKLSLRTYCWVFVALAAIVNIVFFVAGRTGHLTLLLNLVITCALILRGHRILLAAVVLVSAFALLAGNSEHFRNGFTAAISEVETRQETGVETSVGQRLGFAQASLDLIAARPIAGWGTGSYAKEFCRVVDTPHWCKLGSYNPHNQFLFFGVQLGALGILAYLAWLASAAWVLRKKSTFTKALGYSLLATLIIHSLVDSPLYIVTEGAWYPLMLGILTAKVTKDTSELTPIMERPRASPEPP